MAGEHNVPLKNRRPTDRVYRGDERFLRGQIDRPIQDADIVFTGLQHIFGARIFDDPGNDYRWKLGTRFSVDRIIADVGDNAPVRRAGSHPEHTPSYVATEIARNTGHVAIANIHCGTGHLLMTWQRQIRSNLQTGGVDIDADAISMTGISRNNYARQSMHPATYKAVRELSTSPVQYRVGDLENLAGIATASQDVTLAYDALTYSDAPDEMVSQMMRITRPGGTILFDSNFPQAAEGSPLTDLLEGYEDMGYTIYRNPVAFDASTMRLLSVGTPMATMVYRVDIPGDTEPLIVP